jgi:hypothetical protein
MLRVRLQREVCKWYTSSLEAFYLFLKRCIKSSFRWNWKVCLCDITMYSLPASLNGQFLWNEFWSCGGGEFVRILDVIIYDIILMWKVEENIRICIGAPRAASHAGFWLVLFRSNLILFRSFQYLLCYRKTLITNALMLKFFVHCLNVNKMNIKRKGQTATKSN